MKILNDFVRDFKYTIDNLITLLTPIVQAVVIVAGALLAAFLLTCLISKA